MNAAKQLHDHLLDLCWSLWTELGVRGVVRHHQEWAVDLEALVVATASLGDLDPRLREESLDCLLQLSPYLSVTRLKNILAQTAPAVAEGFGPYAATFNAASRSHVKLPCPKTSQAHRYTPSKKSDPYPLLGLAQASLRLRAIFGVGARADVLGVMLSEEKRQWSSLELASRARFVKLVVSNALHDLENAGIVSSIRVGNRDSYTLKKSRSLTELVGKTPQQFIPWPEVFGFLLQCRALVSAAPDHEEIGLAVDANRLLDDYSKGMAVLHLAWDKPEFDQERWWGGFVKWLGAAAKKLAEGTGGSGLLG